MSESTSTNPEASLRVDRKVATKLILKRLSKTFVFMVLFSVAVYAIMAGTIARYVNTNMGVQLVSTPIFDGGYAKKGDIVFIDLSNSYNFGFLENLQTAVVPKRLVSKVEILEGPYGKPNWEDYGVKGKDPKERLTGQYIFKCIDGLCEPGNYGIAKEKNILGVPVGEKN